ncbi:Spaf_1101 family AAA-like ATPase [Alteribacter keqinensis]|uniref:RecF/RecN/SMC N-terminal domain-containing protein n=1 Tax=Alteribacter keqinensis TaxID=2483800 RepID=A0A3M7TSF4_9BACI|nr:AAA family ATPase [Alteribacter keqinensis]RNA68540.1 hypothetical protein EBO34_00780 [Alteribacter keqinensis]
MSTKTQNLTEIVDKIEAKRISYGVLKKCEIHFHTPASHDYELINGKSYNLLNLIDIIKYAAEANYLTKDNVNELKENIDYYETEEYSKVLRREKKPFASFKEYISYMMIAHKMYLEEIEVAVITDHNTIQGYKKLEFALNEYYRERIKPLKENRNSIKLFLGVEISCSEQNHLIGIFDESKIKEVQIFLEDIIISEEEGTYYTSESLIKEIVGNLDGITYIAHLNSSNLHGSGLYNRTLFESKQMDVFGLTNLASEDMQRKRIRNYNKFSSNCMGIVHESDSHSITSIGVNNTWIKFSKVNFPSLKKAFKNHSICIYPVKPLKSDIFIKGMTVHPGTKGFLKAKYDSSEPLLIDFSRDLNCIIGGRGTGKSTLINIIEVALTREIDDLDTLKFISNHKKIYILFRYQKFDYLLEFIPQIKDIDKEYFVNDIFLEKAFFINMSGRRKLSSHWTSLYKIEGDDFEKINGIEELEVLSGIYRRSYSINHIISKINEGKADDFIREVVLYGFKGDNFTNYTNKINKIDNRSFKKYVRENSESMIEAVKNRKSKINEMLEGFNDLHKDLILIKYSPKQKETDYYLKDLLDEISSDTNLANTYLTWNDVSRYIQEFSLKYGFMQFVKLLLNKRYTDLDKNLNINGMVDKSSIGFKEVTNLQPVTDEAKPKLYASIFTKVTKDRDLLEAAIIKWFDVIDEFTIKFNVNSKEQNGTVGPLMKDIIDMSLGQKVVAILTLVFKYGYYTNDHTPLIIDQPEDNLDNQYIYKNLVESLRKVKNSRQVIVVTHNSTIVTNSDTEQVIIMESNNKEGWIENKGYPSDSKITKAIINCLEGGIDSFNHKMSTYAFFIKEFNQ